MNIVAVSRFAGMWNDVRPLAGIGTSHDGHHGFGLAQVVDFMRHTRLDIDKVACLVINGVLQIVSVNMTDVALKNVKHQFESIVNVRVSDSAGSNRSDIHG